MDPNWNETHLFTLLIVAQITSVTSIYKHLHRNNVFNEQQEDEFFSLGIRTRDLPTQQHPSNSFNASFWPPNRETLLDASTLGEPQKPNNVKRHIVIVHLTQFKFCIEPWILT